MSILVDMEERESHNGKRKRERKPREGFIARVNLEALKNELGMSSVEDIGVFLELANPKGVYNWSKEQDNHGTRPSYNSIVRMMQRGATAKSLFGVECAKPSESERRIELTDDLVAEMMLRAGELLKKRG